MKKTITRFAPSPTGYIHIGNVRSAIYPYLVAKQNNGTFILRIEDTDRARFVPGATELIQETLEWLGLNWDEGPAVGGNSGPYFQTERTAIYYEWAQKLIDSGRAYADPTPAETIQGYRTDAGTKKQPFLYRNYRPENPPKWEIGLPLRFKSSPKAYTYTDEVMGELKMGPETQDDIILIKADGLPTYNFAHIVDDATMNITHVIRGQEYLPSMGNYLALYEALGLERPYFVHLPHILGSSGTKKLSKRDGAKSVTDYKNDGILPEAMLNFLACLGWNDGTEKEIYTKDELIKIFNLHQVQRSGARFDEQKLIWLNGQWIRQLYSENREAFFARTQNFWGKSAQNASDEQKLAVIDIVYDRLKTLSDLSTMTDYFFADPKVDLTLITDNKFLKNLSQNDMSDLLAKTIDQLENTPWQKDTLQNTLNQLLAESGKKPAELFSLIRIALSFAPFSPALHDTLFVLGQETSLRRLRAVLASL